MDMCDDLISVIIPVYNEERNIRALAEKLLEHLHGENLEIIFVDDGSQDASLSVLRELSAHPSIRYVSFSRNFGHQCALKAGFDFAEGDCAITMDGDLQHPVELVPHMIAMWRSGADVVHSRRREAASSSWFKKITTYWYYKIFSWCASVSIEPGTADFRLLDRKIVDMCKTTQDDALFWRGFIPWLGFRQEFLDYESHPRAHGASRYTLKKMVRLAWTGIASFSMAPLRMASTLGALGLLGGMLYFCYILWLNIYGAAVPGWSSLMMTLLFFSAVQLLCLGVLGEYIGKIYMGAKRRPHYILRETSPHADQKRGRAVCIGGKYTRISSDMP